jgi:hypothetical protein
MQSFNKFFAFHYDNSIDAFIPEHWAMEGVAILQENMVAANLVHRDFEDEFAKFGDVVNTRKPSEFVAKRKGVSDDVTIQNANATNIPVELNQHVHTSFLIRDGEESKSFKSLVNEYLMPATLAMARYVDQLVLAQYAQFLSNQSGSLGGLTSSNAVAAIANTGLVMDRNKAYITNRQQIWTPEAQSLIIQNPTFHEADKVGDNGTALRTASIGDKLNFRHWMCQNMSQIRTVNTQGAGSVDNAAGYPVGTTVLTVADFLADEVVPGDWISINGKVYHVTATNASIATSITLEWGLVEAVDNDDVIVVYHKTAGVDAASGYAAGYSKYIAIDNLSGAQPGLLQVGQLITIGTSNVKYVVMDVDVTTSGTETLILLDRPLEAAIVDNAVIHYGPEGGGFNMAFHRNALTLAVRPLALPRSGAGAISGLGRMNGATMRVVITYDGNKQGHLVTLDFLAGIKVLDTPLGAVTLS